MGFVQDCFMSTQANRQLTQWRIKLASAAKLALIFAEKKKEIQCLTHDCLFGQEQLRRNDPINTAGSFPKCTIWYYYILLKVVVWFSLIKANYYFPPEFSMFSKFVFIVHCSYYLGAIYIRNITRESWSK